MSSFPISIRLDPSVREILETDALKQGVALATYLRELATARAKTVRKASLRAESKRVGEYVQAHPEAQGFYEAWGTPDQSHG